MFAKPFFAAGRLGPVVTPICRVPPNQLIFYLRLSNSSHSEARSVSRGFTILLVDDEEALRALTKRILHSAGYTVVEAASAEEARIAWMSSEPPVDLLLTDVIMPRVNGWQLAEELTRARPQMRVLFLSGFPGPDALPGGTADDGALDEVAYLQKPFTPADLLRSVREALRGARPRSPGERGGERGD